MHNTMYCNGRPLCSAHLLGICMSCIKDLVHLLGYIIALKMVPVSLEQMPIWCALAISNQAASACCR